MKYFQTWHRVSKLRRLKIIGPLIYIILQLICGIITRHAASKTEWGYGGGKTVDGWCRWCNKPLEVPYEKALFVYPDFKHYRKRIGTQIQPNE
ncbi:hypothetical protein LCGC14_2764120 [marine sediment metagenome]|uniref:Uncharacterized protein n=1 Tax=marine sediment metagenome TaxID=412755 RepID=A0A0F8YY43_9ZZZZ